jgi:hypothetical protein
MLACKYHSFPIYFSFEFNVVSIERKNFPIEVKLVNASMYQKRPPLFGTVHWPVENLSILHLKSPQNSSQNQSFKTCPCFSFWDIIF